MSTDFNGSIIEFRMVEVELMDSAGVAHSIKMTLNPDDTSSEIVEVEAGREYSLSKEEFLYPTTVIDGGGGYGEFSIECALKGADSVYTFEPNPLLYQYLLLNTKDFGQIKTFNAGLWTQDTDSLLYFRTTGTASASIHEIQFSPTSDLGLERIKIQVKLVSIKRVIREILSLKNQTRIAVKLDIEGAEHAIMDSLAADGSLKTIDKMWIEYHYGEQKIINILLKYFNKIVIEAKDSEMGLIRASRE